MARSETHWPGASGPAVISNTSHGGHLEILQCYGYLHDSLEVTDLTIINIWALENPVVIFIILTMCTTLALH
jgi:hypothetical protein